MDNRVSSFSPIVLAILIVAASIELAYGTFYVGLAFLFLASFLLFFSATKLKSKEKFERSSLMMVTGIVVILADLVLNYVMLSEVQTFDTMLLLFGFSLIFYGSGNRYAEIGKFGVYFALIFLVLFAFLFMLPARVSMYFPYLYGHYAVAVPVVRVLEVLGIDVRIADFRLIEVLGENHALLRIDLACFGWYSLLLVTSMVTAYNITFRWKNWSSIWRILIVLIVSVYLANLLRVATLVYLTYRFGTDFMLLVHSHLGWIFFVLVLLPLSYKLLR